MNKFHGNSTQDSISDTSGPHGPVGPRADHMGV
ncbi:hypothetical protein F383_31913 [Gossypium arboreum]|uniref:Uncharacterized protein n=1 Tax=Gossypium arboreum TaxID=29729 RepID=A0A0B0PKP8_GOSAR|nr:hypothetical protein F383_31913 [Gossypium arboreum]